MRVSDFKKKIRRTSEKSFEDMFAECLTERGIYSRHMSDKFAGVFDRYVEGGRWVELKSLEYASGVVPYAAGMSVAQKRFGEDIVDKSEDEAWYLALIHVCTEQYVVMCPMNVVLSEPGNAWDCKHEASTGFGWCEKYKGKETLRDLIPRDWYI